MPKWTKYWYHKDFNNQEIQLNGAYETLEKLSSNYELIIASNGPHSEQKPRLDNADLSKYFTGFYISEKLGVNKPDLNFFNKIFDEIDNKNKSSILIIGDDLSTDIQGAVNAGIDSCWFKMKKLNISNYTDL